jgi:hypothetical protein
VPAAKHAQFWSYLVPVQMVCLYLSKPPVGYVISTFGKKVVIIMAEGFFLLILMVVMARMMMMMITITTIVISSQKLYNVAIIVRDL